jgi:hypothetical protein
MESDNIEHLRSLCTTLYRATRGDKEFDMLVKAYEALPVDLVDVFYGIVADDLRAKREVDWKTLDHVTTYLADRERIAEASLFCNMWIRQRPDLECWKVAALLACHQGDYDRWRHAYFEAQELNATRDTLLVLELAAAITFREGLQGCTIARELLTAIPTGQPYPIIQILVEDVAIQYNDGALLVELSKHFSLDPPPASRREAQIQRTLQQHFVDLLRARASAVLVQQL